jgi:hypothetical protein
MMFKQITKTTGLVAWITLIMGVASLSPTGEPRWTRLQQYRGQITSIKIDKCGLRPGLCEGSIILTQQGNRAITLAIRPGTWIKRGERLALIEELRVGDEVHVQAFEIAGEQGLPATNIDIITPR